MTNSIKQSPSIWTALLIAVSFAACSRQAAPQARVFDLKGTIVGVDKTEKLVTVDHEAIPGFMEAMTMPYRVRNESYLEKLGEGDEIDGQVIVGREGTYLDNVKVSKKGGGTGKRPALKFHAPEPGEAVPDFELVNQDGKTVRFSQYRGKSILLTFIYTRCPLPDYCPRMNENFAVIEKDLARDPSFRSKTHLLSISFDPKNDTPKALKEYGRQYAKTGFDHWEFVVAPEKNLPEVAKFFGLLYKEAGGMIDHGMSTAIVTPDGKIFKWYTDNEWTTSDVTKMLRASLNPHAEAVGTEQNMFDGSHWGQESSRR